MNLYKLQNKKIFYIFAGTLVILLILFFTLLTKQKKLQEQTNESQPLSNAFGQQLTKNPLPRTVFSDYTLNTELPTLPPTVKLSDLKVSYTTGEALDFATKMGFNNPIVNEGVNLILVTNQENDQETMLSINKMNGNWVFVSEKGIASSGTDPTSSARSFLTKLGLMDDSLIVTATYTRASYPGITFVELHRSWEKLGLPYLNPVGILNLDQSETLSVVKLGYVENGAPNDPDVTSSSDGYVGRVRPNGFNTVTVAVNDADNTVLNATSNVKVFTNNQVKSTPDTLKTPEEAFEEMKSGKVAFSLVKPMGEGAIDVATVFPNSQAVSQNAVVNEVVLTYLDEVGQTSQATLYPFYLFRGTTVLDSGYEAQFVQTVPAVKQINTLGVFAQNSEPTVFPGQGSTLQYGTFNWLSPAPNTNNALACAGLTQIFQLPNGGYIGWYPNTPPRTWYYVPPPGELVDKARLQEIKSTLRWEAAKACKGSINDPTVCAFDESVNFESACYYAGAGSPFIFVYSNSAKSTRISLIKDSVTYADPGLTSENYWEFTTSPGNELRFANGLVKNKLYYEYDKNIFNSTLNKLKKNRQAFVVGKDDVKNFVSTISEKTGLNGQEEAGLLVELTREVNRLSAAKLKVGILDRSILDKVLPVSITPQPETYHRFFFYVAPAGTEENLTAPVIEKLTRTENMVVELGVLGF